MKNIFKKLILVSLAVVSIFSLAACGKVKEVKAAWAQDCENEVYGIAVKKGANSNILTATNKVINDLKNHKDGDMLVKIEEYYVAVDAGNTPSTMPIALPDLSNNTNGTLRVGTEAGYAPFEFLVGTQIVGVDVALMTFVAEELNMKMTVTHADFDGLLAAMSTGTFDVIAAALTITPERAATVDFSDAYYGSQQYIVFSAKLDFKNISDLKGLKIGVQTGNTGDLIVTAQMGMIEQEDGTTLPGSLVTSGSEKKTTINRYTSIAVALQDLKNGKIDAIVLDKGPALSLLNSNK